MESSIELLYISIGIIVGVIIGGLAVFFVKGKNQTDNAATQEFEKERVRLQTDLKHAGKTIEEKILVIIEKDRQINEITSKYNESAGNLGVAREKLQTLEQIHSKLNQQTEEQTSEISAARNQLAQFDAYTTSLKTNLDEQRNQNNLREVQIHELNELNSKLYSENATLLANLNANEGKLATQKAEIEDIRQKSHLEFESIANRLLDAKTEKFTESNRVNIQNLLEPLGKEINSFKIKVDETYNREAQERFSLGEKVRELIETTDKVSAEANNLATALKGQAKTQGNWGEMILERILEKNGLVRGREYDVQHPIKNSEGDQQFLDVIVHLPDNRKLIIDSKVTLVAYDRYCASETDEDRERNLKDHLKALSTHIDQLSDKKYDEMETSPDFVMLFVPIEPAYLAAIQFDAEIWARAYDKRILLISPTNLMGAVKMVSDLWKRDQQSKNALEIANQGTKLYDKFIGFLNTMEDVGNHITKTQDAYNRAFGQLKTGRGNLVSRAERLKQLGVKSSKTLPVRLMDYDQDIENDYDDGSDVFELNVC